jgi:hypothetical protein
MASVGSQYVFSAAQTVNLVASLDGNQATLRRRWLEGCVSTLD